MGDTLHILRRKLAAARPAEISTETAARVWRIGLARSARELAGLPFAPDDVRDERRSLAEVLDQLPDHAFYAILEGPGEALGLLCLSADLVSALVEAQTLGAPLEKPAAQRRMTRTDAALCAGVIDGGLQFLDSGLAETADFLWACGFRYSSFLEDPRPLPLLLEEQPYRCLSLTGTLTGTRRSASALLCLPAEGRPAQSRPRSTEAPATDPAWTAALSARLGEAEVTLMAELTRITLSLEASLNLKTGSLLPIGRIIPGTAVLTDPFGEALCPVRLGRQGSLRALRLDPPDSGEADATAGTAAPPDLRRAG